MSVGKFIFSALGMLFLAAMACGSNDKVVVTGVSLPVGWKITDSVSIYKGEELFYLIDGGAELFLEYGFREASAAELSGAQEQKIRLELYEMNDSLAAFGVFSIRRSGDDKPVAIGDHAAVGDGYLFACKGNNFLQLSSIGTEIPAQLLEQLATSIFKSQEKNPVLPKLTQNLISQGYSAGSLKYFRGPIALNSIYYFGQGVLGNFTEGASGENAGRILLQFFYSSTSECLTGFERCKSKARSVVKGGLLEQSMTFSYTDKKGNLITVRQNDTILEVEINGMF